MKAFRWLKPRVSEWVYLKFGFTVKAVQTAMDWKSSLCTGERSSSSEMHKSKTI